MSIVSELSRRAGSRAPTRAGPSTTSSSGADRETVRLARVVGDEMNALAAARALVRAGVGPRLAKKIVEDLTECGASTAHMVPDRTVSEALLEAGVAISHARSGEIDARSVRARTGLSQRDFARRYGLSSTTVQNWEQNRSRPDAAARALLRIIAADPAQAAALLAKAPS